MDIDTEHLLTAIERLHALELAPMPAPAVYGAFPGYRPPAVGVALSHLCEELTRRFVPEREVTRG